jgi:peptidoglycan/xylan/chitin deacetylase (PgdA/CDA1 family)
MYHGIVAEPLRVPDWCFVDAGVFEAQIIYLKRHFDIVHLDAAMEHAPVSGKPRVCLTFDDGFANVASVAAPILRRHRAPATVFLVTSLVDTDDTVWFARLHAAIETTSATSLNFGDETIRLNSTHERAKASARLQAFVKQAPASQTNALVAEIAARLGTTANAPLPANSPYRILDRATIRELLTEDLIRFGGHTTRHTILTRMTLEEAKRDLVACDEAMRDITGRKCVSFAYPNGRDTDYDANIVSILRSLGVELAFTTEPGPWTIDDDPLRIRRYGIGQGDSLVRLAWNAHHVAWLLGIAGNA